MQLVEKFSDIFDRYATLVINKTSISKQPVPRAKRILWKKEPIHINVFIGEILDSCSDRLIQDPGGQF